MPNCNDLYARVTQSIVAALERGTAPWHKPWTSNTPGGFTRPLRHNGTPYRGINVLMLWDEAQARGYRSPYWVTFRQCLQLNAHVRKGETATKVVYAEPYAKTETDAEGETQEKRGVYWKAYSVFNAEQIDGLPAQYRMPEIVQGAPGESWAHVDTFFAHTGAVTIHGGDRAYYHSGTDRIHLPPREAFRDAQSYWAVRAHETCHWTKASSRLNRDFGATRWGDEGYAMEELVAEIGAAFVCADLHLSCEARADHAAYLAHWLKALKADNRAIFSAASHAQRACDYLQGLQGEGLDCGAANALRPEQLLAAMSIGE